MIRNFFNIVFFLLGSAAGLTILEAISPSDPPDELKIKLDFYKQHIDEIDTLFIGTSRFQYGINPVVYDETLANEGLSVKSFNMGIGGMEGYETDAFIDKILALQPEQLKWLFIETTSWSPHIAEMYHYTERAIWWHDLDRTLAVCRGTLTKRLSWMEKLDLLRLHISHMFIRYLHAGKGEAILKEFVRGAPPSDAPDDPGFSGFSGLDITAFADNPPKIRKIFLAEYTDWETKVNEHIEVIDRLETRLQEMKPGAFENSSANEVKRTRLQIDRVLDAGYVPIYFNSPKFTELFLPIHLSNTGVYPFYLDFNDPIEHADLYQYSLWYDASHLTTEGATLNTTKIAKESLPILTGDDSD